MRAWGYLWEMRGPAGAGTRGGGREITGTALSRRAAAGTCIHAHEKRSQSHALEVEPKE